MILWAVRQLVKWTVIGALMVSLYTHRDAVVAWLAEVKLPDERPAPAAASATAVSDTLRVRAERNGHFFLIADVNGVAVRFMVDTGATLVALTAGDAKKLGLSLNDRDFSEVHRTANGVVKVAPVNLRSVRIGQISLRDVDAVVNDRLGGPSLLGMSFLSRLSGFAVQGDELILSR